MAVVKTASQRLRLVQAALLFSIALSAAAAEYWARGSHHNPANGLFHALSVISLGLVGATLVVRQTLVRPSEVVLIRKPNDTVAAARWKTCCIFLYIMCEVLGLFGVTLRLDGFPLASIWGFYLGSVVLLLLYSPARSSAGAVSAKDQVTKTKLDPSS
jgi:uncharacterized membrane protein